jgi:hypothetical protein
MAKRTYDIRVRNAIERSGDPDHFPDLHIPRSTALQWIREGVKEVVTHSSLSKSSDVLIEENFSLQKAFAAEKAKNELAQVSLQVVGFQMQYVRVAAGNLKEKQLSIIAAARSHERTRHHKRVLPFQHQVACHVCAPILQSRKLEFERRSLTRSGTST